MHRLIILIKASGNATPTILTILPVDIRKVEQNGKDITHSTAKLP
jgi:hypothetical protein